MTGVIIHSIHCRGYRGGSVGFDDSECDCGATIKSLTARLAAAQTRNECPICGLTPGAISTCFCEECVGELQERLAAAEALNKPRMSLHAEIARLQERLAAAEAAMKAAASLPGRLWLTGQLALAEFLSGEGGENLDYTLEQYEAAKGWRDE